MQIFRIGIYCPILFDKQIFLLLIKLSFYNLNGSIDLEKNNREQSKLNPNYQVNFSTYSTFSSKIHWVMPNPH